MTIIINKNRSILFSWININCMKKSRIITKNQSDRFKKEDMTIEVIPAWQ